MAKHVQTISECRKLIKKVNEQVRKANEAEEYKEYSYTITRDGEGNIFIDADDYAGTYKEWQDLENNEEIENVIDIAKDEQIKDDIEDIEKQTINYIDIIDIDFDEDNNEGTFTLGVTFDYMDESVKRTHEELEIGDKVTLKTPYKGYKNAEIIDYECPYYRIKLYGSGLTISVYADELE